MGERKRESFSPPAVGGVSLLVVFAVLCLTVFALLSLATVQADARLADASVQAVSDYYAADCAAQAVLAQLRRDSWHRGVRNTYACSLSDRQELEVEVVLDGEDYTVLRWQVVAVGEWVFDDSLNVWDGTLF